MDGLSFFEAASFLRLLQCPIARQSVIVAGHVIRIIQLLFRHVRAEAHCLFTSYNTGGRLFWYLILPNLPPELLHQLIDRCRQYLVVETLHAFTADLEIDSLKELGMLLVHHLVYGGTFTTGAFF